MQWSFAKYVGCGNDFILFDNRSGLFRKNDRALIKKLCHRHWGIGADGLILWEYSTKADSRMRIFNNDGSEAEMCGNGLRCFVKYIHEFGIKKSHYHIETMDGPLAATLQEDEVTIEMGLPQTYAWNIPLSYEGKTITASHLNTGVPHVVLFFDDVDAIDFPKLGHTIRHHQQFSPKGANVNAAQVMEGGKIKVRTYERGVEAETLACGTGAIAVALAAAHHYGVNSPSYIETRSGEGLRVQFDSHQSRYTNVTLSGPCHCIFQGIIDF